MADRVGVMVDGRLLQMDAPERIYHFPASVEIARLTGVCDFVPGSVRGDGGVDTPIGVLRCVASESIAPGQAVSVLITPDDLELAADGEGQGDRGVARVQGGRGYPERSSGLRRFGQVEKALVFQDASGNQG